MSYQWEMFKREQDMRIGWCAAQAGRPFDPNETEFWIAGYQIWPEPLKRPPTMTQQFAQSTRSTTR